MAKAKDGKAGANVPNKPAHIRVSYLYQAAAFLAQQQGPKTTSISTSNNSDAPPIGSPAQDLQPISRRLVSDLRNVSLKTLIRMSPELKQSICKNCDAFLIEGSTCTSEVENKSRGGKKPWADVLVRKCNTCWHEKRFPLAKTRQKRRPHREPKVKETLQTPQD
jgi:ribonuclease P protein subunit RPR2